MDRRPFWLTFLGAAVMLILSFWTMRTFVGPILSTGALCYILWPHRDSDAIRRLLAVSILLLTLWILSEARAIVYPALAALALAFLLDPAVSRLSRGRVPRGLAALTVMLPVLVLLLLFIFVLIPELIEQTRTLLGQLPKAYETVRGWAAPIVGTRLNAWGAGLLNEDLSELLPNAEHVLRGLLSGVTQVGRGVAAAFQIVGFFLLFPILTYYILVDFGRLRATIGDYLTDEWRGKFWRLGVILQETVGAWLKGQLLVALILAALTITGFFAIGLPYALLLGFLSGLLNLVPVLGFWITFLLSLSVALFAQDPVTMLLKAALVLLVIQVLETHLFSPRIVGKQLGVKPVILLLTMLGLSVFLGILGVLFAAPVIGLTRGIWTLWGPAPIRTRSA